MLLDRELDELPEPPELPPPLLLPPLLPPNRLLIMAPIARPPPLPPPLPSIGQTVKSRRKRPKAVAIFILTLVQRHLPVENDN